MQKGKSARRFGLLGVALIAVVGLTVTLGAGAASAGPGHAVTAKKKCKKAKKRAVSAKKKKCKVHHVVLPAPAPLVRATVSWPSDDLDLHAFDSSGAHSGFVGTGLGGIEQGIPNSSHSADSQEGGSESFTDNIFVLGGPANREFSYVVCFYTTATTTATFTGVTRTGQTTSLPLTGANGDAFAVTAPGGPPVPSGFTC